MLKERELNLIENVRNRKLTSGLKEYTEDINRDINKVCLNILGIKDNEKIRLQYVDNRIRISNIVSVFSLNSLDETLIDVSELIGFTVLELGNKLKVVVDKNDKTIFKPNQDDAFNILFSVVVLNVLFRTEYNLDVLKNLYINEKEIKELIQNNPLELSKYIKAIIV